MKYKKYAKLMLFGTAIVGELHDGFHRELFKQQFGLLHLIAHIAIEYAAINHGIPVVAKSLEEIENSINKYLLFSEKDFNISKFNLS